MESKQAAKPGRKKAPSVVIIAAVLAAALIAFVLFSTIGSQKTAKSTLEGYLNAMYAECLINDMTPFLVEEIRQTAFDYLTLYGSTASYLLSLRSEKEFEVGEGIEVSVTINREQAGSAAALTIASSSYGASALVDVSFTATFKGSQGSADYTGIARMVKVSGKWYLTEYDLPLAPAK